MKSVTFTKKNTDTKQQCIDGASERGDLSRVHVVQDSLLRQAWRPYHSSMYFTNDCASGQGTNFVYNF